jgi:hypothetical protein
MKKLYMVLLIILGVIVLAIIGLTIAVTMPKSLGVKYTKADLDSANAKAGIKFGSLPSSDDPASSLKITGKKPLNQQFTDAELTAFLNQPVKQWKNYPVSDIQMRINPDGSVEMTGKIIADRFEAYSKATNMPQKYTGMVADKAGLVPVNPSFYYKGTFEIKDGKVAGEVAELKIGPVEVPKDWAQNNKEFIEEFISDRLKNAGMDIESASYAGGKLSLKGTVPEEIDLEK